MNIIVSQDKAIRLTQYSSQSSYDLDQIKIYLAKPLFSGDGFILHLIEGRNVYYFYCTLCGEVINYYIYKVYFLRDVSLSGGSYQLKLEINDKILNIPTAIQFNDMQYVGETPAIMTMAMRTVAAAATMTDQHKPIDIVDRRIVMPSAENISLIAEDNVSQCLTFRIPQKYDGVDFTKKTIYVDFIDLQPGKESLTPLRNMRLYAPGDEANLESIDGVDYMLVKWVVPYAATKKAGTLTIALSVVGSIEDGADYYIWQTQPASLTIKPNLYKRADAAVDISPILNPLGNLEAQVMVLDHEVETLDGEVQDIKNSDIYALDGEAPSDNEILFNGGGAPIE